jgi:hypothetical protein
MRKIIGRLATLAAAGALAFMAFPSDSASAGWNGQQLSFCTPTGASQAMIIGPNQNGEWVTMFMDNLTPAENCLDHMNVTWNWWWKGDVSIYFRFGDQYQLVNVCDVPDWNEWGDVYRCDGAVQQPRA